MQQTKVNKVLLRSIHICNAIIERFNVHTKIHNSDIACATTSHRSSNFSILSKPGYLAEIAMSKISSPFLIRPTLLALAAAACASASAQQATQTMSEVVVSASGFEQELKQAPASISVVTREELEKKSFRDLADALQGVEGIDVRGSTGKTGGFDISMRGMPSEYTLVLIDGRRPNPGGDTTPNGFGSALTSLIPPMSAIERIEVIRGPMSTLYGSDAMGGVVNIITRKIAKEWGGSVQVEGSLPENHDQGAVQKTSFYLNGPIQDDKLGLAIRGSYFNRDGSNLQPSSGNGSISSRGPSPTKSDQHSIGARLTFTPSAGQEIWLDADSARSSYDNRRCELGTLDYINCDTGATNATASGYADELQFNRDQYAIGYKGKLSIGLLESSLSYSENTTKGRTVPTAAANHAGRPDLIGKPRTLESTSTTWDAKLVSPIGEQHLLSIGTQYSHTKAIEGLAAMKGASAFKQNTWAVFAEDEWSLTDSLTATGGLRYDHHDKFGGHWSPRAYLVWTATQMLTLKGGVSQGFRAPKINQMVDGLAGYSGQGTTMTIGNPALKPEESTSTELGMLFDNQQGWTAGATAFHNKIKNKIVSDRCDTSHRIPGCVGLPNTTTFSHNQDEGKTWGMELSTKYIFSPEWNVAANYTWTDSELIEEGIVVGKLSDVAKHVASATLNWNINNQWSTWLQAEYRGKSRRFNNSPEKFSVDERLEHAAVGDIKGYALFNLGAQYRVSKNVTISGTIYNLFDKDFLKFTQWTNNAGNTQWANHYVKSGQSTKGSIPDGRTLWLRANVQF